jgi:hypothetical protein
LDGNTAKHEEAIELVKDMFVDVDVDLSERPALTSRRA